MGAVSPGPETAWKTRVRIATGRGWSAPPPRQPTRGAALMCPAHPLKPATGRRERGRAREASHEPIGMQKSVKISRKPRAQPVTVLHPTAREKQGVPISARPTHTRRRRAPALSRDSEEGTWPRLRFGTGACDVPAVLDIECWAAATHSEQRASCPAPPVPPESSHVSTTV